jgi:mRNA-degrading endonuclease toxin of MazEF toxin-antitoxin module
MNKDFDSWNKVKKDINGKSGPPFYYVREIWWCSLGLNVGSEEDGKNELYERPILILKVFNKKMVRVVPLTSSDKEDDNHTPVLFLGIQSSAKLSQLKTISTQRLSRRLCILDHSQFEKVVVALKKQLI